MKWIITLLVVANAAFFAWHYQKHEAARPKAAGEQGHASGYVTRLVLLSELPGGTTRPEGGDRAPVPEPPRDATAADGALEVPEPPPPESEAEALAALPLPPAMSGAGEARPSAPPETPRREPGVREPQTPVPPEAPPPAEAAPTPGGGEAAPHSVSVPPPPEEPSEPPAPEPAREATAAEAPPQGVRAGEAVSSASPAVAGAGAPAAPVPESPVAATQKQRCYAVGPFVEGESSEAVRTWLGERGGNAALRWVERQEPRSYWVYLPPAVDAATARETVVRLAADGVKDVMRIPDGPRAHAISLGLYNREAAAERRVAELKRVGYEAAIEVRLREVREAWLDVAMEPGRDLPRGALTSAFPKTGVAPADCR
jgi:hypothetical protein